MAYNIHQQLEMILHKQASLSWYILLLSPRRLRAKLARMKKQNYTWPIRPITQQCRIQTLR